MYTLRARAIPWSSLLIWAAVIIIAAGGGALVVLALLRQPVTPAYLILTDSVFVAALLLVMTMMSRKERDEVAENRVVLESLHHRVNDILKTLAAAAERVESRADALQGGVAENNALLDELTTEIPKVATSVDVKQVKDMVEAAARDRDLQIAALHDELAKAKDEAKVELQACMRWVLEQLGEAPR